MLSSSSSGVEAAAAAEAAAVVVVVVVAFQQYNIQGVPGGKDLTSGECSLGQTIPI